MHGMHIRSKTQDVRLGEAKRVKVPSPCMPKVENKEVVLDQRHRFRGRDRGRGAVLSGGRTKLPCYHNRHTLSYCIQPPVISFTIHNLWKGMLSLSGFILLSKEMYSMLNMIIDAPHDLCSCCLLELAEGLQRVFCPILSPLVKYSVPPQSYIIYEVEILAHASSSLAFPVAESYWDEAFQYLITCFVNTSNSKKQTIVGETPCDH